jgi:hypothetical protein
LIKEGDRVLGHYAGCDPSSIVGVDAVLHLISDDVCFVASRPSDFVAAR